MSRQANTKVTIDYSGWHIRSTFTIENLRNLMETSEIGYTTIGPDINSSAELDNMTFSLHITPKTNTESVEFNLYTSNGKENQLFEGMFSIEIVKENGDHTSHISFDIKEWKCTGNSELLLLLTDSESDSLFSVLDWFKSSGDIDILCEFIIKPMDREGKEKLQELLGNQQYKMEQISIEAKLKHLFTNREQLRSGKYSDFKIIVGKTVFPVHRTVLAANSKVFDVMFQSGLDETQKNQLILEEFSIKAVSKFLDHIYTGEIPNMNENSTEELLALGDKYDLEYLKMAAEQNLIKEININNICQLLAVAKLHEANQLKKECLTFFGKNKTEILATDQWITLSKTDPILCQELSKNVEQ